MAITTCQKDAYFSLASGPSSGSSATGISISAGDLFRFLLHSAWSAVKRFVIRVADGIYEVLVHIGDVIYHAALDCVAAVTHAVEWVFTQLKVAFETIRDFLGFVFNWGDIVRTHKVIKNVATQYAHYGLSRIGKLQDLVSVSADTLEETLNNWAGIPDKEVTAAESNRKAAEKSSTYSDPQTHYVQDKVKSNMANAKSDAKATDVDMPGDWGSILSELKDMAVDEQKTVANSLEEIKTQIIDGFGTLTPLEIVKRLVAIVGKLVIETARNVVVKTLGIVKSLTKSVLDELNTPISIPVVSKLYKFIAHDELSIMDLVCLVAAVPATIVFKAVIGSNPFPDNSATTALIEASDFAAVQKLLQNDQSVYKTLTIVSEFAAMAGLGFTVIANTIKIPQMTKGKPHEVPDKVKQASIPIKLLVLMPGLLRQRSSNDPWYFQMDAILTDMAFLKVCLDSTSLGEKEMYGTVSPYIDFAISALWIVPSIGKIAANHAKTSSYMSLTRSLAYDVAVMTGPIVWSPSLDPETKLIMLVVGDGLIVITAGVSVATGRLLQDGD